MHDFCTILLPSCLCESLHERKAIEIASNTAQNVQQQGGCKGNCVLHEGANMKILMLTGVKLLHTLLSIHPN